MITNDPSSLRPAGFFASLSSRDKVDLIKLGTRRFINKDEMVFQVGTSSDEVYILLEGRVKVFELSCEGREVILWFCFPGELFGLSEVMKGGSREVNAYACGDVKVMAIGYSDFEKFISTRPAAAMSVIDVLGSRLRELGDVLLNLTSDDVTSRVIKLITRLSERYGKPMNDGMYLDIPLTHQEMADMIGTSRQTVTTVLGDLRRKGILRIEQRTIYIQDPVWVEKITGSIVEPAADMNLVHAFIANESSASLTLVR